MAYANQGEKDTAETWFHASEAWTRYLRDDHDLLRFRTDAAEVLALMLEPLASGPDSIEEHRAILKSAILQPLMEVDPQAGWTHFVLGVMFAEDDNRSKAAEQFALAAERSPGSPDTYYFLSALRRCLGDEPGYRAACAGAFDVAEESDDDVLRDRLVWTCTLGPNALDDLSVPLTHAETLVAKEPKNAEVLYALGALLFRAGQYDQAVHRLEQSKALYANEPSGAFEGLHTQLLLAMTKWKQDRHDEALSLMSETRATLDDVLQSPQTNWLRHVTLEVLDREAKALIEQDEATESSEDRVPSG